MAVKKYTYKKWFQDVKRTLDAALQEAMALKEELEHQVDEMDATRLATRKKKPRAWHNRYFKYVQAVDELDKIVGHLAEADDVVVKL